MQTTRFSPPALRNPISRRALLGATGGLALARSIPSAGASINVQGNSAEPTYVEWANAYLRLSNDLSGMVNESGGGLELFPAGGLNLFFDLQPMVDQGYLAAEEATAISSLRGGALTMQFVAPDPGNPSGTGFAVNISVIAIEALTTENARGARSAMRSSWTSQSEVVELDTGVRNYETYTLTQPISAENPDVNAHFGRGMIIFDDSLLVNVNAVAYDTDVGPFLIAAGEALRSSIPGGRTSNPLVSDLIIPHDVPQTLISFGVVDGQHVPTYEENAGTVPYFADLIGEGTASGQASANWVHELPDEARIGSTQSAWQFGSIEQADAFVGDYADRLAEADKGMGVERLFVDLSDAAEPGADFEVVLLNHFVWPTGEGMILGGDEALLQRGDRLVSYAFFPLVNQPADIDVQSWAAARAGADSHAFWNNLVEEQTASDDTGDAKAKRIAPVDPGWAKFNFR